MAAPSHPISPADRALKRLEAERKRDADGQSAAWVFLWTLFVFKMITVGIIIYAASGTGESLVVVLSTTWYWFIIPVLALAGPMLIRWRMIKLRRRREQLRASEWNVDTVVIGEPFPPGTELRHDR
jgi:hypothetical protein